MLSLPVECLLHVFSYLCCSDLKSCTLVCQLWHQIGRDNTLWKCLSVKRWGAVVCQYTTKNWFLYHKKRSSSFMHFAPSPMHLVQEDYHHKPWQLLVCCILCSRTSTPRKSDVIREFFCMWSTPSDVIEGDPGVMKDFISILGLQELRVSCSKECCRGFLLMDWDEPIELKGIGTFGNDSWRLFCGWPEGPHWTSLTITDRTCANYHRWLVNHHKHPKENKSQTTKASSSSKRKRRSHPSSNEEIPTKQVRQVRQTRERIQTRQSQLDGTRSVQIHKQQHKTKRQNKQSHPSSKHALISTH